MTLTHTLTLTKNVTFIQESTLTQYFTLTQNSTLTQIDFGGKVFIIKNYVFMGFSCYQNVVFGWNKKWKFFGNIN